MGACSNPKVNLEIFELHQLLVTILTSKRRKRKSQKPKPRSGDIKAAVAQILELSLKPLGLRDIHMAVEQMLEHEVLFDTVKDCVLKHARGEGARFHRVSHGRYTSEPVEKIPSGLIIRRRRYPGTGESIG